MYFCIFSYNRGQFLQNCVRSIEQCSPGADILIFDDQSTDEETVRILDSLSSKYQVVIADASYTLAHKCGGLYANMQHALSLVPESELICYLQDDTQVVRALDDKDLEDIHHFFSANDKAVFLQPAFLRGADRARNERITVYDEAHRAYFREHSTQSVGLYFSAISIAHVGRLKAYQWQFSTKEKENEANARAQFAHMGFMKNPILMWLPSVPAYRGKVKTLALSLAEKYRNCGFYPFQTMSAEEIRRFRERSPSVLPVAEDFLSVDATDITVPWITHPLQGSSFLKMLNRIELRAKKLAEK
ncbi:MAG: glycosyltransferase family 2 protein [Verrucomicrobia bacterium]|jgi:glycosyltransferase involved in cell wall biosynthesis|nr:glycosyltransferase family 2 protein [Verrucomicrobiota bacterium]